MRRFRFRLESVRSLRVHAESTAQSQLAYEIAVGASRAEELERADAALRSARAGESGPQTGPGLAARQAFMERRERERQAALAAAQAQAQIVASRSAELASAAAERAALDKLRDRKHEAHRRDAARLEDARLGEIGLVRRGLRTEGGA
jgi:flagellar export protein FliJ